MKIGAWRSTTAVCGLFASMLAGYSPAVAQDAENYDEIIVTARKTSENLLDTPLSISALSGEDLRSRGIVSLQDVSAFTPGMKVVNNGSSRNDRATQQIILRGFTPPGPLAQTASVFIDGVAVTSALAVNNITNPSRVEVLKGPQSAYFGRQTFAGAVNIITKDPSMEWGGQFDGLLGTRANYDGMVELTGPLIKDVLAFSATARTYGKNGSYRNAGNPAQTLGDQSTKTAQLALLFTPSERLKIKAFGMLSRSDDGPSAQGFISAYDLMHPDGTVVLKNQSNCVMPSGKNFFCGVAPKLIGGPAGNTVEDSYIKDFLANPNGRIFSPSDGVQGYGLRGEFYHAHIVADWDISDALTLSYMGGYNRDRNSVFADTDNYYDVTIPNPYGGEGSRPYMDFPYLVEKETEDHSHEVRGNFDFGRLTGVVGASYLYTTYRSSLGGGNGPLATTDQSKINATNRNKIFGLFFGLNYEITQSLNISVDGRWQNDHAYVLTPPDGSTIAAGVFGEPGFYPGGTVIADQSYKSFNPRVIVQYDFAPSNMIYASFSKGISPGTFNTQFFVAQPSVQRQLVQDGYQLAVKPEKIENYEIGLKGRLFDNRLRYTLAAYRANWLNQINTNTVTYVASEDNKAYTVVPSLNAGRVQLTGIEAELAIDVAPGFQVDLVGSVTDSNIKELRNPTVTTLTGMTDFRGQENPLSSKYSAAVSGQYTHHFGAIDADAYIRGDFTFKSGVWSNAANSVRSPNLSLVNVRAGVSHGPANVEFFVSNLFNNKSYTSITDGTLFTNDFGYASAGSALVAGLPELRTMGLRVRYKF